MHAMDTRRRNLIAIPAICVTGMVLLCTGLFWARTYCAAQRDSLLGRSARGASVSPMQIPGPSRAVDVGVATPFFVTAEMNPYNLPQAQLGIARYLRPLWYRSIEGYDRNIYVLRYDPSLGLFVYQRSTKGAADSEVITKYAGPEGIADKPDERLGRFVAPIAGGIRKGSQVLYDPGLKRFFAIEWDAETPGVRKGPELSKDAVAREPVQVGGIWKNPDLIRVNLPSHQSADPWRVRYWDADHVLVLDASGRIDRLDLRTLDYAGFAGRLSSPIPPIGDSGTARPMDLTAYGVYEFEIARDDPPTQWGYGGCAVLSLARDGLALRLEYFDPNGQTAAVGATTATAYDDPRAGVVRLGRPVDSAEAAYFLLPGARGLTWMKLLLENLHPTVLVLASYFGGPHFEATSGYRSIFLLPDSFVAMVARGCRGEEAWKRFFWTLGYMLPGLFLLGLLGDKLNRDAIRMGMPRNARKAWILATIFLGLPAYVAYRMTRPRGSLVTCSNCGQGRRADQDKCHRCSSVWEVPELTPPAWRVVCAPEQDLDNSPATAQETTQSA
jgi:hypothetical protein